MKKMLSVILALTLIVSFSTVTAFASHGNGQVDFHQGNGFNQNKDAGHDGDADHKAMQGFKDMKGHWGRDAVEKIQSAGILQGYSDGTFQPDNAITEAELAVILSRLTEKLGSDDEDSNVAVESSDTNEEGLTDIPSWARAAAEKGFHHQYFNMKRFHSHEQCNRLTACVALAKALGLKPVTDFESNPFTDWNLMSKEDYGYLLALYQEGYISGYPDGNFNPNNLITRAQVAKIIEKLLDGKSTTAGAISDDTIAPVWTSASSVTATAIGTDYVDLKWSAAEDNVKVAAYKVIYDLNGTQQYKYFTAQTGRISGLDAGKDYTFKIAAKDAAGNLSEIGPSVTVSTKEKAVEDTAAPTWSSGSEVTFSSSTTGAVTVKWPDAADDSSVKGYKIYKDGSLIKTTDGDANSLDVSGLSTGTEYTFKIRAFDAAGNLSTSLTGTYLSE